MHIIRKPQRIKRSLHSCTNACKAELSARESGVQDNDCGVGIGTWNWKRSSKGLMGGSDHNHDIEHVET